MVTALEKLWDAESPWVQIPLPPLFQRHFSVCSRSLLEECHQFEAADADMTGEPSGLLLSWDDGKLMGERLGMPSGPQPLPRQSAVAASKRRPLWLATTVLLVAMGVVISLLAAGSLANSAAARSREAFKASSGTIASTLQLAIQHESDLNVSAGGFIAGDPQASNSEFDQWASSVHAVARYPELVGMTHLVLVSSAELPAFAARWLADQVGPLATKGPLWSHRRADVRFTAFWRPQCRWANRRWCRAAPTTVLPGPIGQLHWLPKIPAKAPTCPTRSARPTCWRS